MTGGLTWLHISDLHIRAGTSLAALVKQNPGDSDPAATLLSFRSDPAYSTGGSTRKVWRGVARP